jgi:hypothetical protein
MRSKCEICLENDRDNTGPVKKQTRSKVHLHVMPANMVYDKGKGMQKRKQEKGVCAPSMEDLQSFV